ncbi:MAG: hypothetical protein AAFQ51_15115, partial [Pseudomonadota bacterium]
DPNGSGVILDVSDGGSPVGSIIVEGSAAQSLKGLSLGGGDFELTTDPALISFHGAGEFLFG